MTQPPQVQVTFDSADPVRVGLFWCAALGYAPAAPPDDAATWDDAAHGWGSSDPGAWFACSDPAGARPRLYFQRVPEGKVVKNRVHLDVKVGAGLVGEARLAVLEAECTRLLALGATRLRLMLADEENESCLVMADVEGNEFCLD
ncbi:VOC family protein [Cellulomonas sp. SLBN-39]|uniref:VOC family protein n=1 Tax=Cellulomonas sp. SLBN-39 TaxID=2768446 RepID=UPI00115046B7|nr:VOC family protein [Cellulomonas sp. SLBN-39]TQL03081.1 hypothetical protein FBY24_2172 [Cellulomonas sp. SLBN-39]